MQQKSALYFLLVAFFCIIVLVQIFRPNIDLMPKSEPLQRDNLEKQIRNELRRELTRQKTQEIYKNDKAYPPVDPHPPGGQKRILVTGGAGFIGSHLVDVLMMRGHQVIVVDNLFTGRKKNIGHWEGHSNFEFIRHDVIDPFTVEVDEIYHLACPASPPHYQFNPIKTIKTSALGTLNMLGLANRLKARMLFTSTSEVYGDPLEHPQSETYHGNVNPIGPRACYDEGKRVAETLCYEYVRGHNLTVRVARVFNTYGPRMHPNDGRVVSNFVIQALKNEPITIYGSGSQTRSFQFVSDLVRGLIRLMESDLKEPCNLGNPVEYTILDFAKKIRDKINPSNEIRHLPGTEDDPQRRQPNITRAKKHLLWEPEVSLDEGLEKTIEYFRHELELPGSNETDLPIIWMDPDF